MAEKDESPPPGQVKAALAELNSRREKYEGNLTRLAETGETQIRKADPQARRMHTKDGLHCRDNGQTAVDA